MRATVGIALILTASLSALVPLAPAAEPASPRDISPLIKAIVQQRQVPGMVGAIVEGRSLTATGAAGVRKLGSSEAITVSDQFHIGSCTKAMTATVAAMLVEADKIKWDSTTAGVLSDLRPDIRLEYREITLAQLLCHRAGLPRDIKYTGPAYASLPSDGALGATRRVFARKILETEPATKAGEFLYSNAGYIVVGSMLEKVSQRSWESLLRDRLFAPLGMKSAGFGAPGKRESVEQPWGHSSDGTPIEPGPRADNLAVLGPAGGVHCAIADWAKFVTLHLRGEQGDARLLKAETFKKLHEPWPGSGQEYAMGWNVTVRRWGGGRVLTHTGTNTYWYAVTWVAPARDFAVLAACNQGGEQAARACDDAAWALIHEVFLERDKRKDK